MPHRRNHTGYRQNYDNDDHLYGNQKQVLPRDSHVRHAKQRKPLSDAEYRMLFDVNDNSYQQRVPHHESPVEYGDQRKVLSDDKYRTLFDIDDNSYESLPQDRHHRPNVESQYQHSGELVQTTCHGFVHGSNAGGDPQAYGYPVSNAHAQVYADHPSTQYLPEPHYHTTSALYHPRQSRAAVEIERFVDGSVEPWQLEGYRPLSGKGQRKHDTLLEEARSPTEITNFYNPAPRKSAFGFDKIARWHVYKFWETSPDQRDNFWKMLQRYTDGKVITWEDWQDEDEW